MRVDLILLEKNVTTVAGPFMEEISFAALLACHSVIAAFLSVLLCCMFLLLLPLYSLTLSCFCNS